MIQARKQDMDLLCFESFAGRPGLVHAFTTKPWNLAPHRGPDWRHAIANRRRLCRALDLEFDKLTAASQIHSPYVLTVAESDVGRGRDGRDTAVPLADGLITDRPGVGLLSLSADCPTLLVYDPARRAVGVAHASWRGTLCGMGTNLVDQMVGRFDCRPADLLVGIGPSAGPCCYEIRNDVRRVAETRLEDPGRLMPRREGQLYFDLWTTLQEQLVRAGVSARNIECAELCTICDSRFYSHRRDGPETGRFGLVGVLRP